MLRSLMLIYLVACQAGPTTFPSDGGPDDAGEEPFRRSGHGFARH